jgi:hypothetical protein
MGMFHFTPKRLSERLDVLIDLAPSGSKNRIRDMASLQEQLQKIKVEENVQLAAQKFLQARSAQASGPNDTKDTVRWRPLELLTKFFVENQEQPKEMFPYPGDKQLFELIQNFSKELLNPDSFLRDLFKNDIELVYFGDRYPSKVIFSLCNIP